MSTLEYDDNRRDYDPPEDSDQEELEDRGHRPIPPTP